MSSERDIMPAARRPLTARSVVASTLLGVDPPSLPTNALVRSGELFGLRAGATRTALSRMAAAGEVFGGDGTYELAGSLKERHRRQQAARGGVGADWDGTWELAVVRPGRRNATERAALREAARRRSLVEIREGCWARPANLDPERSPADAAVLRAQCLTMSGVRPDDPAELLAAFPLDPWRTESVALVEEMERAQESLDRRDESALGSTFQTAAAVLRQLVADPALPRDLEPPNWPATALRESYADFQRAFSATWRAWYRRLPDR